MKKSSTIFLACSFFIQANEDTFINKAAELTEKIYASPRLHIRFDKLEMIENLIYDCLISSSYQLKLTAEFLIPILKNELNIVQEEIEKHNKEKKQVPLKIFYKKFILTEQIKHFDEFMSSLNITWLQKIQGKLFYFYEISSNYIKSFFGYELSPDTAKNLAQEILDYIAFERETILYNYKNLISFLHVRNENKLPKIIDFWDTSELQEKLLKRAQLLSPEVEVQLVGLIMSFALQGLVMAGGTLAIQWYDEDDQKIYEEYQKRQKKISTDWDNFQEVLVKNQKEILNNIIKAFADQQNKLQDEYQTSNRRLREALVYLNQSINLDEPIKQYLVDLINWDQYFSTSPMYTPQSRKWFNIYNVFTKDDWEFDHTTNGFWQNAMTSMPDKLLWKQPQKDRDIFKQDPAIHSIFTEYVPQNLNYDIEVECTLINCQYPFFAGIMFNRGRWISGDPERIWWYRLLGLYGTHDKPDDKETRAINLSFAQQLLDITKTKTEKEKITSPLEQIMTDKTKALNFSLDKKEIASLETNPITFIFKITNKADTVLLELDKKENGSIQKLYSGSVHNLDPYIYLFHGIGFMAIGCQAHFKINKPEALVYTADELKIFENKMEKIT